MQKIDGKVKKILGALDALFKRKIYALDRGLPVASLDVRINALMGALKMLEGK